MASSIVFIIVLIMVKTPTLESGSALDAQVKSVPSSTMFPGFQSSKEPEKRRIEC